jgi:EpsI family protein
MTADLPANRTFRIDAVPVICLAAGAAALAYSVVAYWGTTLDAIDRYLIVAGAVWAGWTVWPVAEKAAGVPRPALGVALLTLAALIYPLAWFLQTAVTSGRAILLWWQWGCLFAAAAGWLFVRYGWTTVRTTLFPPVFLTFALPLPTMVLAPLQIRLQALTTTVSDVLLRLLGYAVTRQGDGFILHLPGGDLGVAEACSGVRSLTALTALAAFVAHWFGFGPVRGAALVAISIPIVALVNIIRVVLSGVIQEAAGGEYIRGAWHEALGLIMVLVGLACIHQVAVVLDRRVRRTSRVVTDAVTPPRPVGVAAVRRWAVGTAAVVLVFAGVMSTFAGVSGQKSIPNDTPAPDLCSIPLCVGEWEGRDRPVSDYITKMLHQDVAVHREYRNRIGRSTSVWVLYWSAASQVRGYHHPDVCLRNAGMTEAERSSERIHPTGGGEIPITARLFNHDRGSLYVLYWTQEGRRVWGPEDERAAAAGLGGRGLAVRLGELFTRSTAVSTDRGRLVVLIGTDNASELGKAESLAFARMFADTVYELCPWASPPVPPDR